MTAPEPSPADVEPLKLDPPDGFYESPEHFVQTKPATPTRPVRAFRTAPMKDGIRYDSRGEPITDTEPLADVERLAGVRVCTACGHYWPEHYTPVLGRNGIDKSSACKRRLPDTTGTQCDCPGFRESLR